VRTLERFWSRWHTKPVPSKPFAPNAPNPARKNRCLNSFCAAGNGGTIALIH
jgi:hypothetical protein